MTRLGALCYAEIEYSAYSSLLIPDLGYWLIWNLKWTLLQANYNSACDACKISSRQTLVRIGLRLCFSGATRLCYAHYRYQTTVDYPHPHHNLDHSNHIDHNGVGG